MGNFPEESSPFYFSDSTNKHDKICKFRRLSSLINKTTTTGEMECRLCIAAWHGMLECLHGQV